MSVSIALIADEIAIGIAGTIAIIGILKTDKTDTVAEIDMDDSTRTIYNEVD